MTYSVVSRILFWLNIRRLVIDNDGKRKPRWLPLFGVRSAWVSAFQIKSYTDKQHYLLLIGCRLYVVPSSWRIYYLLLFFKRTRQRSWLNYQLFSPKVILTCIPHSSFVIGFVLSYPRAILHIVSQCVFCESLSRTPIFFITIKKFFDRDKVKIGSLGKVWGFSQKSSLLQSPCFVLSYSVESPLISVLRMFL